MECILYKLYIENVPLLVCPSWRELRNSTLKPYVSNDWDEIKGIKDRVREEQQREVDDNPLRRELKLRYAHKVKVGFIDYITFF